MKKTSKTSERERERVTPEENCKHKFVRYPPKVGRFKVCTKCSFMWILGDVKFGERSIKLSGSGNYIEASTTTAPASPATGKIRLYSTGNTNLSMKASTGVITVIAPAAGNNVSSSIMAAAWGGV